MYINQPRIVECVKKPDHDYICRAVTVGRTYAYDRLTDNDYYHLCDDNDGWWCYPADHFVLKE